MSRHAPLAPGWFRDLLHSVSPYFEIGFDEQLTSQYLEAARWAHNFKDTLSIRVESPTAHELLEGTLFWQEWQASHPPMN